MKFKIFSFIWHILGIMCIRIKIIMTFSLVLSHPHIPHEILELIKILNLKSKKRKDPIM